ncbi:hypothetical protein Tco_1060531 [Tanacetum coccineum]
MGDENPIRTLGDYSKPSHEGYRNTIELPAGNNVVPLRSDTIRLVQNGCLFHGLRSEDPNQHLKDFPKLVDSLDLDVVPMTLSIAWKITEQAFVEYASSRTDEAGEGLVSKFMASQDARLSKFETDFKRQQSEMTNKIDIVLKAITDQITGTLPSDTVKNPKLRTHPVLMVPQSSNTKFVYTKEDDGEVMFIEIKRDDDEPQNESPNEGEGTITEGPTVEYFDTFPTRDELTYHKYLMCGLIPSIFLRNPIITEGCSSSLKIPCNIGHVHVKKSYLDLNSPLNIMTRMMYNWIMKRKLNPREDANGGISNFTGRIKGMHVFIGNFTYIMDFMIVEDISSIIDLRCCKIH